MYKTVLMVALICSYSIPLSASDISDVEKHSKEYQIGIMVLAVSSAIAAPDKHASLDRIKQYGTDSRYYTMIRGWLTQELKGVQSQIRSGNETEMNSKFIQKSNFLKQAIRLIDLE
jgi:hypothetical protein